MSDIPIRSGTHAERPAASAANTGQYYFETNTPGPALFMSDGVEWLPAGPALFKTYTPKLLGATDNPAPTYTTQIGRYYHLGKLCWVSATVVTSTMTKTTLTDLVRLSLPVAAANVSGAVQVLEGRLENATAVLNAFQAELPANAAYAEFRSTVTGASSALITYAATSPGIGVLTHTITFHVTGWYETV